MAHQSRLLRISTEDLLRERRANVQEQRGEPSKAARAMLQFHIDEIDREVARRIAVARADYGYAGGES